VLTVLVLNVLEVLMVLRGCRC